VLSSDKCPLLAETAIYVLRNIFFRPFEGLSSAKIRARVSGCLGLRWTSEFDLAGRFAGHARNKGSIKKRPQNGVAAQDVLQWHRAGRP
jgi:hypothetical protein